MNRNTLNVILFILPIFLLSIINVANPVKPTVSEIENRALKSKPAFSVQSLFQGHFCRDFEDYFADTFIYRESASKISARLKDWKGIQGETGATIVMNHGANAFQAQDPALNITQTDNSAMGENTSNENTDTTAKNDTKADDMRLVGRIMILNDRAMELHTFNAASSKYYANTVNLLQSKLGNEVKIYSLLAPTQIEFINNPQIKDVTDSQKATIDYVNQNLNPAIVPVDAYTALQNKADQYVYFRTDHHWTALGAYYAYTAFMNVRGENPVPIERYGQGKVSGYLGSTYEMTLNKKLAQNPDTIYYYEPFIKNTYYVYYQGPVKMPVIDLSHAQTKQKYRIFISGDRPLGKIVTEVNNGKKVLVIKDSYGNALIPFLIPHYQEVYVVDPRQFKQNIVKFIKDNGIQEVLFLNYVLVTSNNDFSNLIINMMNR